MRKKLRKLNAALLAGLLLTGASGYSAFPSRLKNVDAAKQGEALVLGKIDFQVEGKPKKCQTFLVRDCWLVILPSQGNRAMAFGIDGDGQQFRWSLPPGDYSIIGLEYNEGGLLAQRVGVTFRVSNDLKPTYIGTLVYHDTKQGRLVDVVPDPVDRPTLPEGWVSAPMALEAPLGSFAEVVDVCAAEWGLTCTKNLAGVTPQSPSVYRDFKPVGSTLPALRWSQATAAGVTYDFALYEAAGYKGVRDLMTTWVPGRLIAYRQGLTEPSWQPSIPLAQGQRYFWSVRLE